MTSPSPSPTSVARKRSKTQKNKLSNPSFADLPSSLLEVIMSHLVLKDNICASAACKSWREAAVYVRAVEQHPWLMCFPKRGSSFQFRDPLQWKLYTLNLPELAKSNVCCSRDGWLLMRRRSVSVSNEIFFFNPFSRELIALPKFELNFREIAFSSPPTLDRCVVVALNFVTEYLVTISTWHPGATEWTSQDFPTDFDQRHTHNLLVYANDRFYCFTAERGCLYSFHPSSRKWNFLASAYMYFHMRFELNEREVSLAEKKGELFLMFTSRVKKPVKVYKLVTSHWEEMRDDKLDGLTIFISFFNAEMRKDLPWLRNNVCFSRFGYNRKSCLSYSFDESRYDRREEWLELCPPQSIWIDPPKNVLDYL
uniref:F-box protein n=1 Tax=Noccaea caerulescens TaxID=107243 RepID=A0A1J3DAE7_NOCCA